ncbi:DNA endonuclease SmrA [Pseudaeromonas sharmana]|uniref:DNA endonuclease SmrA n=1 Tax=Pseudaeromonas sharmana TaxID=328412 RepID=A0ABV8CRY1_9GAMM
MTFADLLAARPEPRDADDLALFQAELGDVRPLTQDHIPGVRPSTDAEAKKARRAAAEQESDLDPDFLSMEAVTLLDPHDLISFRRPGVQEGVFRKLRLGEYALQATLDLQGQRLHQAKTQLVAFLRECQRCEIRTVLIRHGKGLQSNPPALLKSYVSQWLQQWPDVLALHSARYEEGGSSALYVLLRKGQQQKIETRERIWRHQP